MDEKEQLRSKIADIGTRYLKRTLGELAGLRGLIERHRQGSGSATSEIQQLAHRIYGSGSMFGFATIGARARELELLIANGVRGEGFVERIERSVDLLEEEVRAAARANGIE